MAAKKLPPSRAISLLGEVANGYSNFLSLLAVDGPLAHAWKGPSEAGVGDDFARANKEAAAGRTTLALGGGTGIVCEVGGCGTTNIYRAGPGTLVFVEHYADDWDDAIEADFLDKIVSIGTAKKPEHLGTVAVASGALALVALVEPVTIGKKDVATVAAGTKTKSYDWGLLVPMPRGDYDVWSESLGKAKGPWGVIPTRLRIVPKGTPVVTGTPLVAAPPAPKTPAPKAREDQGVARSARRFVTEGWDAIESFDATPDGSFIVAGECGGFGVLAWDGHGERLWKIALRAPSRGSRYEDTVQVSLTANGTLLAAHRRDGVIVELDRKTGAVRNEYPVKGGLRTFAPTPDGKSIVLRVGTKTRICSFPSMKVVAELGAYCNQNKIAISADGRYLVVNGHEVHVFDLATAKHVLSFEPEDSPGALAFSNDGVTFATGADGGMVRLYDIPSFSLRAEIDVAPERSRKPSVDALAFDETGTRLASAGEDGALKVWDVATRACVLQIANLETAIPDTGARQISQVRFVHGELAVSAAPKKSPIALSLYTI